METDYDDTEETCGMRGDINDAKTDYDDIVQAIRRVGDTEAEATLQKMGSDLRKSITEPNGDAIFEQVQAMPAYAALAFRKQFRFASRGSQKTLASLKKSGQEALNHVRNTKAASIHPDAAPAWKALVEKDPATAWRALQLNAMGDPKEQQYTNPDQPERAEEETI